MTTESRESSAITRLTAVEIRDALGAGELSSREVVDAHIERMEATHGDLNAVIWPLFDEARRRAGEADEARARGEAKGRLFGLPMTVKDQFLLRDTPTSCGLAHRAQQVRPEEGPLVARLRQQGAIFLGKTNLPQLLCSHECDHARYGRARNPWDPDRTPGGSSGGEAAIIAAGGSPLGLGGDMGGSIRVPSHFCGIAGLKPTGGRFPNGDTPLALGYFAGLAGFEGFVNQPGPMARSVDDLKLAMDALLDTPLPDDEPTPPVGWVTGALREPRELCVGYYTDPGLLAPAPALQRVVREGAAALSGLPVTVRPFEPPAPTEGLALYLALLGADGGAWVRQALAGEAPIDDIRAYQRMAGLNRPLRRMLSGLLSALGQRHAAFTMRHCGARDARRYWALCADRTRYRQRFAAAMRDQGIDVFLCPPNAFAAPPHGSNATGAGTLGAAHSALFNLLALPAGVVAAGRVGPQEARAPSPGRDAVDRAAHQIDAGSAGLPVGVQVVGRPWREDQVLGVMKALETHFRTRPDFPHTPHPPRAPDA